MWVARDSDGIICLFDWKPKKCKKAWYSDKGQITILEDKMFPEVKWEDEEPTEVEPIIKKQ